MSVLGSSDVMYFLASHWDKHRGSMQKKHFQVSVLAIVRNITYEKAYKIFQNFGDRSCRFSGQEMSDALARLEGKPLPTPRSLNLSLWSLSLSLSLSFALFLPSGHRGAFFRCAFGEFGLDPT